MYTQVTSAALMGVKGHMVTVEVDLSGGFPRMDIVGLPDSSIKESSERVRTAIKNSELQFPDQRITINLAPADLPKEGTGYDLAIALGILLGALILPQNCLKDTMVLGELALNGMVRPIKGVLSMVHTASLNGIKRVIVPMENATEASLIKDVEVIGVRSLVEVKAYMTGNLKLQKTTTDWWTKKDRDEEKYEVDFAEVRGQETVRRALEVAAAGMHNVMMIGPPGAGKTMMAKRLPTILPQVTFEESIELTKIYSVSGKLKKDEPMIITRPFRAPHHTISDASLVGGGRQPKPGEISLAHHGVLFLDELPEFKKHVIEVLRQPLEDGNVTISRLHATIDYPARFMLVCSMNPCPCGYFPDESKCHCSPYQIQRYLNKVSGPLLDRIDLHVEASNISLKDLEGEEPSEGSGQIRERVLASWERQASRHRYYGIKYNAHLGSKELQVICSLDEKAKKMMLSAFEKMGLSARAYNRVLKVARTIADLDDSDAIKELHVAEAIQYRTLDRKYFCR